MAHSDVCHIWANRSKDHKSCGNVFFEGDTIYSYGRHFPIAKHVRNIKEERAVLFTRDTYSKTTEGHKSMVRGALHGLQFCGPVFLVPSIDRYKDYGTMDAKPSLRRAVEVYVAVAREAAIKAKQARKNGEYYLSEMRDALEEAQKMSDFFRLGCRIPDESTLATPEELAKIKDAKRKAREAEKKRLATMRQRDEDQFKAWLRGEGHSCPFSYSTDANGSAYLRVIHHVDGRKTMQTSRGASVPLDAAIKAFRFVKLCRMTGRTFETNGHRARVGDFFIEKIDAEGNVKIGCHYITWERIYDCAIANNFLGEAATDEVIVQKTEEAAI